MQKAIHFNDIAIVSIKESNYRTHFWYMGKDDAINIMNNSNLNEKSRLLYKFLLYIKMSKKILLSKKQRNNTKQSQNILLNNKERLREQAINRYKKLNKKKV